MRKGGTAKNLHGLNIWMVIALIWLTLLLIKMKYMKINYTDLHHRVNQLEKERK